MCEGLLLLRLLRSFSFLIYCFWWPLCRRVGICVCVSWVYPRSAIVNHDSLPLIIGPPIDYPASVLWFTSGVLFSRSFLLLSICLSVSVYIIYKQWRARLMGFLCHCCVGWRRNVPWSWILSSLSKPQHFAHRYSKRGKQNRGINNPWWSKRLDSVMVCICISGHYT